MNIKSIYSSATISSPRCYRNLKNKYSSNRFNKKILWRVFIFRVTRYPYDHGLLIEALQCILNIVLALN